MSFNGAEHREPNRRTSAETRAMAETTEARTGNLCDEISREGRHLSLRHHSHRSQSLPPNFGNAAENIRWSQTETRQVGVVTPAPAALNRLRLAWNVSWGPAWRKPERDPLLLGRASCRVLRHPHVVRVGRQRRRRRRVPEALLPSRYFLPVGESQRWLGGG